MCHFSGAARIESVLQAITRTSIEAAFVDEPTRAILLGQLD